MLERGDKGRQRLLSRTEAGIEESNLALWLDWNGTDKSWIGLTLV